MRNCVIGSIAALATVLVFPALQFAQAAQQPGTTKAGAQRKLSTRMTLPAFESRTPHATQGRSQSLDLGGHPNPLLFRAAGQAKYENNELSPPFANR